MIHLWQSCIIKKQICIFFGNKAIFSILFTFYHESFYKLRSGLLSDRINVENYILNKIKQTAYL